MYVQLIESTTDKISEVCRAVKDGWKDGKLAEDRDFRRKVAKRTLCLSEVYMLCDQFINIFLVLGPFSLVYPHFP